MPELDKGYLITFEGGEGCGKSTQSDALYEKLTAMSYDCVKTREPGGTESAEQIREVLIKGAEDKINSLSEVLLHYAARCEHYEKLIKPSLDQNKIVICDRFFDSTLAYQGYGLGESKEKIQKIREVTIGDFKPDLTLILDVSLEKSMQRVNKRLSEEFLLVGEDRYEKMDKDFHIRVREGFHEIAESEPERCVIIDTDRSVDKIQQEIIKVLQSKNIIDNEA